MSSKMVLVPATMHLDRETIGAINFHCGDGADGQFGEYSHGLLWVGAVTDDYGKEVYGLHLATADYPEEGSTTLVEFAAPVVERQPSAWLDEESGAIATDKLKPLLEGFDVPLFRAPPELAELQAELADTNVRLSNSIEQVDELQATIDRLTAEFGRLKKAWHASVKVTTQDVMQAIEEIPGAPMLTSNHCHALAMRLNFFIDKVKELNH